MASLCRMCGDKAEIVSSLLDPSQHHLQWAIRHFHITLDNALPTSVCIHCDEIIQKWTLFLSKRKKAVSFFSTLVARNQLLLHRLNSNTSVPSKPSTSNNLPQSHKEDCISVNDNSSFATPIEAIYIPVIKREIDLEETETLLTASSKNHIPDKQSSIQIEKPPSSSLSGTERLVHSHSSNTSVPSKPSTSAHSTSKNPPSASTSNICRPKSLVTKYHIRKDMTIRVAVVREQVLDPLQQNDTVDCNVVDNQMSEQRNVDDIEVPFEAIQVSDVKCDPDLVKSEPSSDLSAPQSENLEANTAVTVKLEEIGNDEEYSDVEPDLLELEISPETSNPGSNKDVNISASVFNCTQCNFTDSCENKLQSHIVNHHVKISSFQCQECRKSFKYESGLHKHIGLVHPNKCSYKCPLCKQCFELEKYFNDHMRNHNKVFQCDVCNKMCCNNQALTEHKMRIHTKSSSLSCDMCSKIFYTEISFKKHIQAVHSNLSYKCDICDVSYKSKSFLKKHEREIHTSVLSFSCNQCEKTFVSKQLLKRHSVVHSDKRIYKCEECNSCFNHSSNLTRHVRRAHSNVRAYQCHLCGKSFKLSDCLKQHLTTHSDARNYICEQCGKQFKNKGELRQHSTSHSEMRPFACAQCNLKFKSKANLVKHLRQVHSDLRPFSCDKCSFACKLKYKLKLHQLAHSNVRKFECNHCKIKLKSRDYLRLHIKRMHLNLN